MWENGMQSCEMIQGKLQKAVKILGICFAVGIVLGVVLIALGGYSIIVPWSNGVAHLLAWMLIVWLFAEGDCFLSLIVLAIILQKMKWKHF